VWRWIEPCPEYLCLVQGLLLGRRFLVSVMCHVASRHAASSECPVSKLLDCCESLSSHTTPDLRADHV
jgi:hypothetical protein